ncbi:MAG: hypothetical protein RL885_06295 [Planctomycetota bacterium]
MRCRNSRCPVHDESACGFIDHGRRRDVPVLVAFLQQEGEAVDCPLLDRLRIAAAHQQIRGETHGSLFALLSALGKFRANAERLETLRHLKEALGGRILARRQSSRGPRRACGSCRSFGPYSQLCLRTFSNDPLATRLVPHPHFGIALTPDQDPSGLFPPCRAHDPVSDSIDRSEWVALRSSGGERHAIIEALLALAAEDPLGARLLNGVVIEGRELKDLAEELQVSVEEAETALSAGSDRWLGLFDNLFRHGAAS